MKKILILFFSIFYSSVVWAEDFKIEMLNKDTNGNRMVFSEEVKYVNIGDTITWEPTSKGHYVEMVASPGGMKFKSKINKVAQITFNDPGIYYYHCPPHAGMGMIGIVVVGNDLSNKEEIAKAKARGKGKKKLVSILKGLK